MRGILIFSTENGEGLGWRLKHYTERNDNDSKRGPKPRSPRGTDSRRQQYAPEIRELRVVGFRIVKRQMALEPEYIAIALPRFAVSLRGIQIRLTYDAD